MSAAQSCLAFHSDNMSNVNEILNSTLIQNCMEVLPNEYFIMSPSVMLVSTVLFLLLFLTTALIALQTRKSLLRRERTWITTLDFIGGIGGVDSIFESYDTFLGKDREELRREFSEERRRMSCPQFREDLRRQTSVGARSSSVMGTSERRPTLKEEEDEVVKICIEMMVTKRSSVGSLSAETIYGLHSTPPTPVKSPNLSTGSSLSPSPGHKRKFIKNRPSSIEGLRTIGQTKRIARKKHSVIHEINEQIL